MLDTYIPKRTLMVLHDCSSRSGYSSILQRPYRSELGTLTRCAQVCLIRISVFYVLGSITSRNREIGPKSPKFPETARVTAQKRLRNSQQMVWTEEHSRDGCIRPPWRMPYRLKMAHPRMAHPRDGTPSVAHILG